MMFSDCGAAFCTLVIFILITADKLEIWHLYVLLAIGASFATFQWPAYSAAMTLLVPKQKLGRANGLVQPAEGVAQILAPVMAGVLVGTIMVQGIMLIDIATFLFTLITLLIVRIPRPGRTAEGQAGRKHWEADRSRTRQRNRAYVHPFRSAASRGYSSCVLIFSPAQCRGGAS